MNQQKIKIMVLLMAILSIGIYPASPDHREITIAMTGPLINQIKNIEILYQRDLITLERMKLICIYHEDEKADYETALDYVKKNELNWVDFHSIKGQVKPARVFGSNQWTPEFKKIFENSQGIIFTGGEDIPPELYNQEHNLLTAAKTPSRSYYECSFVFHLLGGSQDPNFTPLLESNSSYAVLGICLGAQTLNIATGGTVYQDIPSEIYEIRTAENVLKMGIDKIHSSLYIKKLNPLENALAPAFHRIKFIEDKYIWKIGMKDSDTPLVLSSHHQAIKELGKDFIVIATSIDGRIPEIIQHIRYKNVIGVQFHPEYYALYQKGIYYKKSPEREADFNLRSFLINNPISLKFHENLWKWFSDALLKR